MESTDQAKSLYIKVLSLENFPPKARDVISDYLCPLCKGITFNPVVDSCGHIYCERCFEIYISKSNICPINKSLLEFTTSSKIPVVTNILNKQTLWCSNKGRDCKWTGPLKDFEDHIKKDCPKQPIDCLNKGCHLKISREHVEHHGKQCQFRIEKCKNCLIDFPYLQISPHQNTCTKAVVLCPQNCGKKVVRDQLQSHIKKDCLNTKMSCIYSDFGCEVMMIKKELKYHIESYLVQHTLILFNEIKKIKTELTNKSIILDKKLSQYEIRHSNSLKYKENISQNTKDICLKEKDQSPQRIVLQTKRNRTDDS